MKIISLTFSVNIIYWKEEHGHNTLIILRSMNKNLWKTVYCLYIYICTSQAPDVMIFSHNKNNYPISNNTLYY